jgi:deferrochelatase/peroxidase EfeB
MHPTLQEGIHWQRGETPPGFFAIIFLGATHDHVTVDDAADTVARLWEMYQGLKHGMVRDLPGVPVPDGNLKVLLGIGPKAFTLEGRPEGAAPLPVALADAGFQTPGQQEGRISTDSGIFYEDHTNPADACFAVQFTADTPLAVERAVVETWKLLYDDAAKNGKAALEIRASFSGTRRDDGRSWIDFHDGVSNIAPADRENVIMIRQAEPSDGAGPDPDAWTCGGSYLAFIRLYIDLEKWRELGPRQEILVGRAKLNGCPMISEVGPRFFPDCDGRRPLLEADVKLVGSETRLSRAIARSHIHRARHHPVPLPGQEMLQTDLRAVDAIRIFRQGYPFLETSEAYPGFRVGLNFVSFQAMPETLVGILGNNDWLEKTNFGGDAEGADDYASFITARAAGFFLVPSCRDAPPLSAAERFPGDRALTVRAAVPAPA